MLAGNVKSMPDTRFTFVLGYRNYYAIHGSPYMSTHVLIENTLVQHKMANNLCMALCCQNQVSKGTNQRYELHSSVGISVHSASVTVLGLLKKKEGYNGHGQWTPADADSGHGQK